MDQVPLHVTEGVLVGHQFDVAGPAEGGEVPNLLGGERRRVGPHLVVAGVGEGVLDVQLEVVDLPAGQQVDERVQRVGGGNLVAADIQHDPAYRQVGMIRDLPQGPAAVVEPAELGERAAGMGRPGRIGGVDVYAVAVDADAVSLGPQTVHPLADLQPGGVDGGDRRGRRQVEMPWDRQQWPGHRSSGFRYPRNVRPITPPSRTYGRIGPTQLTSARSQPSSRMARYAESSTPRPRP